MEKQILNVNGMSCNHCVNAVIEELKELDGVKSVKVSLENKNCEVSFDENVVTLEQIKDRIIETGYEVVV